MAKPLNVLNELFIFAGLIFLAAAAVELHDYLYGGHSSKELADSGWWSVLTGASALIAWRRGSR